jgi:two-component system, sensor histidine kinase
MLITKELPASEERELLQTKWRSAIQDIRTCIIPEWTGSALTMVWLWDSAPKMALIIWTLIGAPIFLTVLVPLLVRHLTKENATLATLKKWKKIHALGAGLAGLRWGIGSALAFSVTTQTEQQIIPHVIVSIGFASVAFITTFAPGFYLYVIALFSPIIIRLGVNADQPIILLMTTAGFLTVLLSGRHHIALSDSNLESIAALKRERDKAEAATQAKSRFLSTASHDLRQPIHALALFVSILKKRIRYPDVAHLVDRIEISVKVMEEMFNSLLDLSKLTAGTTPVHRESLALADVLEGIEIHFAPIAHAKGLEFRTRFSDAVVKSDLHLLRQILHNLASNAVRYTSAGGVLVAVRKTRGQGTARIEVWDTGCGIPSDKLQEVFAEFVRLPQSQTADARGLGIGLTTAQQAASLLGATVKIRSTFGRGSCFSLEVPLTNDVVKPSISTGSLITSNNLENALILIVDDDEAILESMRLLLQRQGGFVIAARTADEAMSLVTQQDRFPDLIISDYQLGEETTGLDVVKRIHREVGDEIPTLIVTGSTLPSEDYEVGALGYRVLQKPVDAERFLTAANAMLSGGVAPSDAQARYSS